MPFFDYHDIHVPLNIHPGQERVNYIRAIRLVSLNTEPEFGSEVPSTAEGQQEPDAAPVAGSSNVLFAKTDSNGAWNPSSGMSPNTEVAWKTIRFFSALFRIMLDARVPLSKESRPAVGFAQAQLVLDRDRLELAACAFVMAPGVLEKAVDGLLTRRREQLRRLALGGTTGVPFQQRRPSESDLSDEERAAKRQEMLVFHLRLDRWIWMEDEKAAARWEGAKPEESPEMDFDGELEEGSSEPKK